MFRPRPARQPSPRESAPGDAGASAARERLLGAAAHAFMERGYAATSIDDIAGVLGATKGAVYHHFASKADVYFSVHLGAMQRIDAAVRPVFGSDLPVEARLRQMAVGHLLAMFGDFAATKVAVRGLEQSLLSAAGAEERRKLRGILRMRDDYERMFRTVIEAGIAGGVFVEGPPRVLVKGLLGALNWTTLWYDPARSRTKAAQADLARTLADYAVRGMMRSN